MNPLDRRIAELKGWQQLPFAKSWHKPLIDPMGPEQAEEVFTWSVYDAKAFQLVDELSDAYFFIERFGADKKRWKALFGFKRNADGSFPIETGEMFFDAIGEGDNLRDAICKAYILSREFLARKPGV